MADASADAGQTDYARDKRGGELAALDAFGAERSLLVRAGLILGPYENIGRLPWWLTRMARGGPVLAPGPRELPLQYVDVRDLAEWILGAAERGLSGRVQPHQPPGHTTMGELLDACVRVTGGAAELRWTDTGGDPRCGDRAVDPAAGVGAAGERGARRSAQGRRVPGAAGRAAPLPAGRGDGADTWAWLPGLGGVAPRRPDRPAVGLDPRWRRRCWGSSRANRHGGRRFWRTLARAAETPLSRAPPGPLATYTP